MTYLVWSSQQEEVGRNILARRAGSWSNRRFELGVWINIPAFQKSEYTLCLSRDALTFICRIKQRDF